MLTKNPAMSRLRVADDITQLVGETPMLQLKRIVPAGSAEVFAKLEYLNPGGSLKDRAAIGIIRRAEREGKLTRGGTIVEATAGNTGIGLALIGVNRGYKVKLFVPENFSQEKVTIMRALGADVERTPDAEGMQGAIRRAKELVAGDSRAFMAGQFENPANPDYHYETTAHEIFDQMQGSIDAVVLGCGTCGTFTGVARYVKEKLPRALAVAVETQGSILCGGEVGPHKVEGIGVSFIPRTFDRSLCDGVMMVMDDDAFGMVKALAAQEGVLSGSSGGAAVFASLKIAQRLGAGKRVVTIIPDSAERYLSKKIFEGGI
ncbi:O-acetylserine dependent cystathionine beta-synthase [Candidatus Sulfotelmatobacter kueseliae]|uniref:Cysteine synthase n=1 Tax=Candidatus Sulfotelmatobacter kueseliae TaxID=2042962 RepID=A0A2U3KUC5_9BACT|nr:O-acetylserine dependent cystathionine beta-synthase [Candidatus Sulfotelmatobacter kueseliae]